ncbi:MAG: aldo/keto reductase [Chloroflexi bacterium]|nr:aldo/keto reductase [Chloroflexota bacterium]
MENESTFTTPSVPERIALGKTGLQISPLGLGTMQWGDRMFWDYGKGGYSDNDLRLVFERTLQAGVNFFDSAESYGNGRSETLLGQSVRAAGQPVVVASKYMPYPWRLRKADLIQALRRSLSRLGLPKLDLYQIHWPFPPRSVETWAEALADAAQAGLVQAVGVSNYSPDQMQRSYDVLARRGIPLASNQVRFNLLSRGPEKNGLLQACRELGVTLIAYSPLSQGLLTGKYTPQNPMRGVRGILTHGKLGPAQALIGLLREIGQAHGGKSPSQVALNWVMAKGALPIPGAKNLRQAEENLGALGWRLSENEIATLDAASDKIG